MHRIVQVVRASIVLLVVLVAQLCVVPVASAADPSCTRIHMIGLRGSGEHAVLGDEYMGTEVFDVYSQLVQRANYHGGIKVTVDGVSDTDGYPAEDAVLLAAKGNFGTYFDSVEKGVTALAKAVGPVPPDACVVLAGYSQGAWVIGKFLDEPVGREFVKHHTISAIVLFGDPRYDPSSPAAVPIGKVSGEGMLRVEGKPVGSAYLPAGLVGLAQSYCLEGDPVCGAPAQVDQERQLGEACYLAPACPHKEYISRDGLKSEWVTQDAAIFIADSVFPRIGGGSAGAGPVITGTGRYVEGDLVYLTVSFAEGSATGFGFRGVNGAGWAEESHSFSSPSYGRVSPGKLAYPFNHGCTTARTYESDVEFWLYDHDGAKGSPVTVHLSCR